MAVIYATLAMLSLTAPLPAAADAAEAAARAAEAAAQAARSAAGAGGGAAGVGMGMGGAEAWGVFLIFAGLAVVVGYAVHMVVFGVLARLGRDQGRPVLASLVRRMKAPSRFVLPLLALHPVLGAGLVEGRGADALARAVTVCLIAALTWAAVRAVRVVEDAVKAGRRIDVADNLAARRIHTQATVVGRTLSVVIVLLGTAAALMTFPQVRQVGTSLLASAGIIGLIAGVAARPILENLLAGIQIAFTEPVRIDDVVVVEGEWGRIEEITPTYIVVRIWDARRLIVPLSHFISKPIENWTRRTADILGTVMLYTDYSVPVQRLREELKRVLDASPHWDKRGWALQVTDATDSAVQVRALMSAADGPTAFELRCEVREKLIDFIRREHPGALPRVRAELAGAQTGLGPR